MGQEGEGCGKVRWGFNRGWEGWGGRGRVKRGLRREAREGGRRMRKRGGESKKG